MSTEKVCIFLDNCIYNLQNIQMTESVLQGKDLVQQFLPQPSGEFLFHNDPGQVSQSDTQRHT